MYLLAIDTATNCGGVALSRNSEVVATWVCRTPLAYAERIIDWIDRVLSEHSLSVKQVDCFAAATGPGTFTGIRIGVATVKALAQALDKPVIGIPTLEALAYRFRWAGTPVSPLIDARRQQVFAALYRFEGLRSLQQSPPSVLPPAQWLDRLPPGEILFVGDGAEFYRSTIESLRPDARIFPSDNSLVEDLCRLAYFRYTRGQAAPSDELRALYVRPSDAELGK